MDNLESLNSIFDEFQVKLLTLAIFKLDELYAVGKGYTQMPGPPSQDETHYSACSITFDTPNDTFCSIFLDGFSASSTTQEAGWIKQELQLKLRSEIDILSSDFAPEEAQPILTSERNDSI